MRGPEPTTTTVTDSSIAGPQDWGSRPACTTWTDVAHPEVSGTPA